MHLKGPFFYQTLKHFTKKSFGENIESLIYFIHAWKLPLYSSYRKKRKILNKFEGTVYQTLKHKKITLSTHKAKPFHLHNPTKNHVFPSPFLIKMKIFILEKRFTKYFTVQKDFYFHFSPQKCLSFCVIFEKHIENLLFFCLIENENEEPNGRVKYVREELTRVFWTF